ncbi:hypothetical protein D3C86_1898840 [compost metagenome]
MRPKKLAEQSTIAETLRQTKLPRKASRLALRAISSGVVKTMGNQKIDASARIWVIGTAASHWSPSARRTMGSARMATMISDGQYSTVM